MYTGACVALEPEALRAALLLQHEDLGRDQATILVENKRKLFKVEI